MADLERIVNIVFAGEDRLSETVRGINTSMGKLDSGANAIAAPFAKLADGVLAADAALGTFAAVGTVAAYDAAVKYEDALVGLNKVLDENTENIEVAKVKAAELSNTYGSSVNDIIGMATDFKQAGFSLSESLGLVEDSLKLMVAGDMEAATASQSLVRVLKGLGEEAGYAGEVLKTVNWASNNFATNSEMLAEALARSAPLAKTFGMNLQEMTGVLVPMIEVFQDSELAATAFKTGLARLKDDTGAVKQAFEQLGFSAEYVANRSMMSQKQILEDVAGKWGGLNDSMKSVVSSALFGKEHFAKFSTVLDNFSKYTKIATADTKEMSDALEKELAARLQSSAIQIDRLKNNWTNMLVAIGNQFKSAGTGIIGGVADIENAIKKGLDAGTFEPFFKAFREFGDNLGDMLREIAEVFPEAMSHVDFSPLMNALNEMGTEVGAFFGGIDLTKAEDLTKALQWVVDGIASLVRISSGMAEQFKPLWDALGEGIRQVNNLDAETAKSFGNILGAAKLVSEAGSAVAYGFFIIQKSGAEIQRVFDLLVGSARALANSFQVAFSMLAGNVATAVRAVLEAAAMMSNLPGIPDSWREGVHKAAEEVELFQQAIKQDFLDQSGDLQKGLDQIKQGFTGVKEETGNASGEVEKLSENVKSVPTFSRYQFDMDTSGFDEGKKKVEAAKKEIQKPTKSEHSMEPKVDNGILDNELRLMIAQIDASSEIVQSKIEWEAKLDIAEAEANAEILTAYAQNISDAYESTASVIGDAFGVLGNLDFGSAASLDIMDMVEDQLKIENRIREENLQLQKDLVATQIALNNAKTKAMNAGQPLVQLTIDGVNLEAELRDVARRTIEWMQIEATEEGLEGLLGLAVV